MTRRIVLVLVAMALAVTVLPSAAQAADRRSARVAQTVTDLEDAVRLLEPYVSTTADGAVAIEAPAEVRAAIHPAVLARLELSAALSGSFATSALDGSGAAEEMARHCRGRRGFSTRWWGWRYYMDSCQTRRLVSLLEIGGTSTAVFCAAFGLAGFACVAFGAALAVLAQSIDYIGGARSGIRISACWVCIPLVRRQ